jgi:hypothetical protein
MLQRKWDSMQNHLDERGRRIWAASEAESLGHGGVTIGHSDRRSAATGMSRSAITGLVREPGWFSNKSPKNVDFLIKSTFFIVF